MDIDNSAVEAWGWGRNREEGVNGGRKTFNTKVKIKKRREKPSFVSPLTIYCMYDQSFSGPSTGSSLLDLYNETFPQSSVFGPLLYYIDSVPHLSISLSWYQTP